MILQIGMTEVSVEEVESLQREFDWVLGVEVKAVVEQLRAAVQVVRYIYIKKSTRLCFKNIMV